MAHIVHTLACIGAILCGIFGSFIPTAHAAPVNPILRIGVAYAPKQLQPALAADAASARLLQLTHPALMQYSPTYQPIPLVATWCRMSTPQQALCELSKTLAPSLSGPLAAQWFQALQSTPRSPFASPLQGITITAPTSTTLAFTLPQPNPQFLGLLTEIPLAHPTTGAGFGSYTVTTHDTLGNVTLTPTHATSPSLAFQFIPDATTRLLKLQNGELDMLLQDLPPELFSWATARGFTGLTMASSSHTYLGFNLTDPLLSNPTVRHALTLATPRADIRRYLLQNQATPATTLLPAAHPRAWPAPQEDFNPAQARAMLTPICGTSCTLTLTTSTDALVQRVAQTIQHSWAKAGITLILRPMEWGSFFSAVQQGSFQMVMLTWTGDQAPNFYHQVFHSSQFPPNGLNRGRVSNTALDALLTQLPSTTIAVQQYLADLRPTIPLYRRSHTALMAPHVTGCTLTAAGTYHGLTTCHLTTP